MNDTIRRVKAVCVTGIVVLAAGGLVQAGTIASDPDYKASTDLAVGAETTIRPGTAYELTGFAITAEFQINLLYQAGILDSDIDALNHYWMDMGSTYNFPDYYEYILNVSATGGLTIYEYDGLRETTGGPEIKWTLTAWHQTILAGDIVDNGDGTITLQVLPEATYRPFVNDPPVNNVEVFNGNVACEVLGYTFTGAIGDIGDGSILQVELVPPPAEVWVDDDFDNDTPGWGTTHFNSIQDGIDAVAGSTVNVAAGVYDEPLNIEDRTDLAIIGQDADTTILKSSTTLPWNVGGYGTSRQSMVRIVNSTGVLLQDLTLDCDLIKGNNRFGISGWDAGVTVDGCIIRNMSVLDTSGGYAELGSYFRAPGYTDAARADVTITGCTFIDAGRVGIVTHDYINATITGNTFYKTFDDFGYAMEIGSQSTGIASSNTIYGYDTPAASDGSESAGIYVENSFTGGSPSLTKNVAVTGNHIYGCQYAMWIGNGYNGYAGDVDIVITVSGNDFHDNTDGAIILQDEDKANGSSVSALFQNNVLTNNGDVGYFIFTQGDGDITAVLEYETISGHDVGVYLNDYAASPPTGSSYSISISNSNFTGNASYGIRNDYSGATITAENNWWGDPSGPCHESPGEGDRVSDGVDYDPWLGKPANPNALYLEALPASIYIQPGESITVHMNVANLQQKVNACQAMLGYSSYFFADPTGAAVAAGGGVWDLVIWDSWAVGGGVAGEIDTAIGVDAQGAVGTDADGTVAVITLTSNTGVEGVTQMVFRPDADPDPGLVESTYLSDMSANPVWPAKVNSTNIYIDGTDPTVTAFSADPLCTKTTTTLTFSVEDDSAGVDYVDVYVGAAMVAHDVASPYALDMSGYATGCYDVSIKVVDKSGNEADSAPASVCVDQTAPAISNIVAQQGGSSVLCPGVAVQGVVDIYVDVVDDGCADLVVPPTVTVDGIAPVTYMDVNGNTYHYQVTVLSTTGNGAHTITVEAADDLGNSSTNDSASICVDKNQITGQVELQDFIGTSREVTFVATGGVKKSWTLMLSFTGGAASYTLTGVPDGTTHLSAKTDWSLRRNLAAGLDSDGQAVADFTGASKLLGGDINGSNSVNILDYSVMKVNWNTANAVADINGNGQVQTLDYSIMKSNWFQVGDAE